MLFLNYILKMKLEIELNDVNDKPINIGDRVIAYEQAYKIIEVGYYDELDRVVVVDMEKPLPTKDIPLFIGKVAWNKDDLCLELIVEKLLADWEPKPATIKMVNGYAYELYEN